MIAAVVPVKSLARSKSRLAVHLSDSDREILVLTMLRNVVKALRDSDVVGRVAVATEESRLATELDAVWIPDAGSLNDTLARGTRWARSVAATSLLVVPADLPYVTGGDVRALVAMSPMHPGIVLAPSYDAGTGALLLTPPDVIPCAFGVDSGRRHADSALQAGVSLTMLTRKAFRQDLDTYADLIGWQRDQKKGHTGNMASAGVSLEADQC